MFEALFVEDRTPSAQPLRPRKGVIIGTGQVGMACAYSLLIQNCLDELILQDINQDKLEGEVMDLVHGLPFLAPTTVAAGSVADRGADADLVIITAGAKQRSGESRLELVDRNVAIFRELIPEIMRHAPNAILLIVSNPVDIMTYLALKLSGLPRARVLGSGTVLDTARLRTVLAERLRLDPRSIHAYILGEHGDSEVAVWSMLNVAGVRLDPDSNRAESAQAYAELEEIAQQVRRAAYEIIRRKGYTSYAIGLGVTEIVQAILRDQRRVMTVSSYIDGLYEINDCCLSVPTVVDRGGASRLVNLTLSAAERSALVKSAATLREIIDRLPL